MNLFENLPTYELVIDELDLNDGVSIMSIVDKPAVEKDFLRFSKSTLKYSFNEEKRIVTGVALRADRPIYRKENGKSFYVTINKEAVEKIMQKFMKELKGSEVNIQHDKKVDGIYLIESFILTPEHILSYPQFNDVEEGSWMVSYKVDNDDVWKQIKSGNLNGFSAEIYGELTKENKLKEIYKLLNLIEIYERSKES